MPNQAERIIEIDRRIRAGEYPKPDQLAVDLEVSRRSILKDLEYMKSKGAPVVYSRGHGGYRYTDKTFSLPAINITRNEVIAFALAVEAARQPLGALLSDDLTSAVAKITKTLDDKVSVDIAQAQRHFSFAPALATEPTEECAKRVSEIYAAIEGRQTLSIFYASARSGEKKWRQVEPHHLHNDGGEWRVFAFDQKSSAMRTFNVARVQQLRVTGELFLFQTDFSPDTFLAESFRNMKGPTLHRIAVRFNAAQAVYICERKWHTTQSLETHENGDVTLRFEATNLEEIARWVLSYGAGAQVLEPTELRVIVGDAAREMSAIYNAETRSDL